LRKISKNSIYIILNLLYIIPGIVCALLYLNSFYKIFEFHDLPGSLNNIVILIIGIPYLLFYLMSLKFLILIHPLVQIIILYFTWKNNYISKKYIIIVFFISLIIASIHLYLIWGKGLIITA
jgi:hypothetical protein